jgi:hypothetical protein
MPGFPDEPPVFGISQALKWNSDDHYLPVAAATLCPENAGNGR